jgi:hypothetical protein
MRVVQRSRRRVRTALRCLRVGDPRLAHHDEARSVLVCAPEEAAGRALVAAGEEVSSATRREDSQAVAPVRRLVQHCDVTNRDDQHQRREHGGPAGEEMLRLGRPRTKEAVEPGTVHQQPDLLISPVARCAG